MSALIQACAPAVYNVDGPSTSNISYEELVNEAKADPKDFNLQDKRSEEGKTFSYGVLPAGLKIDGNTIEPISFLKTNTEKELKARGINTSLSSSDGIDIEINKFVIRNHRASGFSPFVTFTMLSGDIVTDSGKERVATFIKRGKVPVWTFDEIIQPTFNEPLDLVVKELAAKINAKMFGRQISDSEVQTLIKKINTETPASSDTQNVPHDVKYLDVYQLGFGNNKSAIPALVEMAKSKPEYIRLSAISSLGILGADEEIEFLKSIYSDSKLWQDRAMAIKAIADIGNAEAVAFLDKVYEENQGDSKDDLWNREIIELYTN
ncbi:hypothetical protein A9Q79_02280 [Methylophaga sp. 42_25_T18]|nr:hypothetical protein A9Q79_02280 [Methylophaga sp. 42_25_T18]OUR87170.1 hypothetical protein A9Q92_04725 [Methylophaga sp. 42_8_T64]